MSFQRNAAAGSLRLAHLAWPVASLGPGRRVALWTAGCPGSCPGCVSPHLRDENAGRLVPVRRVLGRLVALEPNLDGLTVSGGEPFDRPEALRELLEGVRFFRPQWNIMVYTGHEFDAIMADDRRARVLGAVDLLVDGPYRREIPSVQPWAGSGNQRPIALTAAGERMILAAETEPRGRFDLALGSGEEGLLVGVGDEERRGRAFRAFDLKEMGP